MSTRLMSFCPLLLTGGLLLGLFSPTEVAARRFTRREPQKQSNAQLREALHVLQATKKTLEGADHDYGGHRVKAIKDIGAAEHQLKLALKSQHKKTGKTGGGKAGAGKGKAKGNEPQNVSNLQLADAIVILQRTETFLEKADHDYGGHRVAAVRDLKVAVQQLKTALKFEKKKS